LARPLAGGRPLRLRGRTPAARLDQRARSAPAGRRLVADVAGDGRPVVLLHGQPGSAVDWHGVERLLSARFKVIVPDRLGYGRTGGGAGDFHQNATAVAELLDELGIDRAVVVGYSWAGGVALAFAQMFPNRTAGLVLAASVGPGEHFRWQDRALAAPLLGEALAALTLGMAAPVVNSSTVQRLADRHLAGRAREAVSVLSGLAESSGGTKVWRSFVAEQRVLLQDIEGLAPGLAATTAPTAVVNGGADRLVPPHVADRLAASLPAAVHTIIPGAHHLLLLDQPQAVAAAVEEVAVAAWPGAEPAIPAHDRGRPGSR
jgi:pimeloyl-ACP methyl ester carboxylesterase